jgi:hypothetical protein
MCRERWQPAAAISERAVVADDGHTIRLVIYRGEAIAAVVVLDPARAIGLAGRLIEAGHRRLERPEPPPPAAA